MSKQALPHGIRILPMVVLALSLLIPSFKESSGVMFSSNDSGLFVWGFGLICIPFIGITACFLTVPIAALLFLDANQKYARIAAVISVALLAVWWWVLLTEERLFSPGLCLHAAAMTLATILVITLPFLASPEENKT